jgi:hypothetical protein
VPSLAQKIPEVGRIRAFAHRGGLGLDLCGLDPAVVPGDFLQAGDIQTLALLDRGHEVAGIKQTEAVMGVSVTRPRISTWSDPCARNTRLRSVMSYSPRALGCRRVCLSAHLRAINPESENHGKTTNRVHEFDKLELGPSVPSQKPQSEDNQTVTLRIIS